jgi:predicted transcriptional regulator
MESTVAYAPSGLGRRLSVNVALDVGEAIDELAKRHGTTITDVIRRAVSTYKYIDDETAEGAKILVERDGTVREVKFL